MLRSLLLISAILLSCREATVREAEPPRANTRARLIWKMHEAAVARAVNGEIRNDDFNHACTFFKDVAGIEVHGEGEFLGWMPTRETRADLEVLRAWYRKNGGRLRADEKGHVTATSAPHKNARQYSRLAGAPVLNT